MRARLVLIAVCVFLTRAAAAAPPFRCGNAEPHGFAAGIDCAARPALGNTLASASLPISVHYDSVDANLAQVVLQSAEISWNVTTGTLGFEAPPTDGVEGGNANFDFYLESSQFGGYFCPVGPTPATDRIGYYGWVSVNPEAFDESTMPAVVAHELNHASQLGVDGFETPAFMEMTSAYIMEKVFDDVNLASAFIGYFQAAPNQSLDYYVYAEPYQYGASLFLFWLFDEKLANPALVSQVWDDAKQPYDETVGNEPDFFDVFRDLAVANGTTLEDWYVEFARDRWFTGTNDDGTFTEGGLYTDVALDLSASYGSIPGGERTGGPLGELGASYLQIDANGAPSGAQARFTFAGDAGPAWSIHVVHADGSRSEVVLDGNGEALVDLTAGRNAIVVVNEGDAGKDPDQHYNTQNWDESSFTYSVEYLGDDGVGCGCALVRSRPSPLLGLLALALLLRRRRCA